MRTVASRPAAPSPQELARLLANACRQAGIDDQDARLLRHFSNAVYLVSGVVARIDYGPAAIARSSTAVAVTRWLASRGLQVTVPLELPAGAQPATVHDGGREAAVTFWHYYPQPEPAPPPDLAALGRIARDLHATAAQPPIVLPAYVPLRGLQAVLDTPSARHVLGHRTHQWLSERAIHLIEQASGMSYALGLGVIHGDLYAGNMMLDRATPGHTWRLGDWDSVCVGPREIDLVPTAAAPRFGLDPNNVSAFANAYGFDIRDWEGIHVLRSIRELSTLPALIRLAGIDSESARELEHRLDSLRRGDTGTRWNIR